METLKIDLPGWSIESGDYDDFAVGEVRPFALDFGSPPSPSVRTGVQQPMLTHQVAALYRFRGRVLRREGHYGIIDAGIRMYGLVAPDVVAGDWLEGEIGLGVDPYFYFEQLALMPDMPRLIYDWRIEAIEQVTGSVVEVSPKVFRPDPANWTATSLPRTDAFEHGGPDTIAHYLLTCTRVSEQPRRTLAASP